MTILTTAGQQHTNTPQSFTMKPTIQKVNSSGICPLQERVLIVGGGASGLATCKEFLECGFVPTVFEASNTFGGVFRDAYEKLELTSSSVFTAFSDFPPNMDEPPKMWTGPEYLSYLRRYADQYGLFEHVEFNSKVVGVRRISDESLNSGDMAWEVAVYNSLLDETSLVRGGILVLCVGSNVKPSRPVFEGQSTYDGSILHTCEINKFEQFQGKRVLSLGLGESGSDVPYWIAKEPGTSVTIAARGLGWCVPRRRPLATGLPTDLNTNRLLWGLPRNFNRVLSFIMVRFLERLSV